VYARRRTLLTGGDAAIDEELTLLGAGDEAFAAAIAKKKEQLGASFYGIVRRFLLQTLDFLWVDHLEAMEYLRSSVNLRAYGQRDPLVEYKKEGLKLFQNMEETYATQVVQVLPNIGGEATVPQAQGAVEKVARAITAQVKAPGQTEHGRNDHVTITNGTETREMKYKKAEPLLNGGGWRIVEGA
jgi:preprotein translocase subunit SecA